MRIVRYHENMLDECAEFWWNIYKDMPYVHRPDGWVTINTPPIGPGFFGKYLKEGLSGASYWHGDGGQYGRGTSLGPHHSESNPQLSQEGHWQGSLPSGNRGSGTAGRSVWVYGYRYT